MSTKEKIAVMQAFVDGQDIEVRAAGEPGRNCAWTVLRERLGDQPLWDWKYTDYRIKPAQREVYLLPVESYVKDGAGFLKLEPIRWFECESKNHRAVKFREVIE